MSLHPFLPIVLVGTLRRDFIITPGGKAVNDTLGGHLFYTASGLYHWEKQFGLVSRIGSTFPTSWLEQMRSYGMDTRGIKQTDLPIDHRFFIRYNENNQKSTLHPLTQYANEKLPFPKSLLGYSFQTQKFDSLTQRSTKRSLPVTFRKIIWNFLLFTFARWII